MALRSVYQPSPAFEDNQIRINDEEHRHLTVARAEKGERIEVFDGKGGVWTVRIEHVGRRETVGFVEASRSEPRGSVEIILAQAMIRAAAFELALEKVVEVGVTRIVPFAARRSNVVSGGRYDRWLRIIVEAAKQSKRYHLPALDPPASFDQILSMSSASKIMFAEQGGGSLKSALAGSPVLYLIGPEGGWTEAERKSAREHGFHEVTLGAGILKSDTASILGAALIRYELGGE